MRRRQVLSCAAGLSSVAGFGGLAGCLERGGRGSTDNDEPNGTPTPTTPCSDPAVPPRPALAEPAPGETARLGDHRAVTVAFVGLYRSVRTYGVNSSTHLDVATPADAQFVVAEIRLEVDGEPVEPSGETLPIAIEVDDVANPADRPVVVEEIGWTPSGTLVGFPVPVDAADSAAVVWTGDGDSADAPRWALPADIRDSLGKAPRFSVEAFVTPSWTGRSGGFPVRIAVSNDGERDGRFLAEFGVAIVSDVGETAFEVPAGETVERCLLAEANHVSEGASSVPVVLDTGSQRLRKEVPLRPRESERTGSTSPTPS